MPTALINGASLYHEIHGAGAPQAVFVHGFACTHEDWRHQVAALAAHHTVVACDLRGHGESTGAPDSCAIDTFGADIAALLEALDLTAAVLVGHSMGCRVVLQAYRDAPERVAGLVLVDGSFLGAAGARAEEAARTAIVATGYGAFARTLFSDMFLTRSAEADRVIERALRLPERIGARLFAQMAGWDAAHMTAALERVRVPLLVVQSTYLNAARKRVALQRGASTPWLDMVRRLAPHAQIEIVPGAGHFPMLERPAELNALLAGFASRLAPAP